MKKYFQFSRSALILFWLLETLSSVPTAGAVSHKQKHGKSLIEPKPLHQVLPFYPDELRRKGIAGKVRLELLFDRSGDIRDIEVVHSLHPYLDFSAVQAVLQWKFEPAVKNGRPVSVKTILSVDFNPDSYQISEQNVSFQSGVLSKGVPAGKAREIIDFCSEYCRKLSNSSLDFICEESIKEVQYNFYSESEKDQGSLKRIKETGDGDLISVTPKKRRDNWDPFKIQSHHFTCDYQLVKKSDGLEQRRVVIKINGRKVAEEILLDNRRISTLTPLLTPLGLFEPDRQAMFRYRVVMPDKFNGKNAYMIDIIPKPGGAGRIQSARIWVDQDSFQILKSEIQGFPIEGFEDVFKETVRWMILPVFIQTTVFDFEKNKVLFPSRSSIRVEYPGLGIRRTTLRYEIDMTYKKYKFFTVETGHEIK